MFDITGDLRIFVYVFKAVIIEAETSQCSVPDEDIRALDILVIKALEIILANHAFEPNAMAMHSAIKSPSSLRCVLTMELTLPS